MPRLRHSNAERRRQPPAAGDSAVISCRASVEEKAALAREAALRQLTTAGYLRSLLIDRPAPEYLPRPSRRRTGAATTVSVSCRVSPQERASLAALAMQHGLSLAGLVHALVFLRPRPRWRPARTNSEADAVRQRHAATDLEAAGRELNGLARLANQTGRLPDRLTSALERIEAVLDDHAAALAAITSQPLFFQLCQIGKNLQQLRGHAERLGADLPLLDSLAATIEAQVMARITAEAA